MKKGKNLHCKYGDLSTTSADKNSTNMTKIIRFPPKMTETEQGFTPSAPNEYGVAAVATVSQRYGIQTVLRWSASSRSTSTCDTSTKLFTRSAIRSTVKLCAYGKHQRSKNNQNEERTVAQIFNLPRTASFSMFSLSFSGKTSSCTGNSPRTSRSTFPGLTDSITRRFTQEVIGRTE